MGTASRIKSFRGLLISLRSLISLLSKKPNVLYQELVFILKQPTVGTLVGILGLLIALFGLTNDICFRWILIVVAAITSIVLFREAVMRRTNFTIYSSLPRFRDRIEVIPLHLQGRYQGGLYNYKESIRLYQEAMNLAPLSDLYGIILHDMGASYVWSGRKKEALETFTNAFSVYREKDGVRDRLGIARVHIARMNAYVYFGDCSRSFEGELGKAEEDFIAGMQVCNPNDPILRRHNGAYSQDIREVERIIQQCYGLN